MADGDDRSGEVNKKGSSDDEAFNIDFSKHGEINIKTETGKIIALKVRGSDTIHSVKLNIQSKEHIPFDHQELIYNGRILDDKYTVAILNIKNQSTLTVTGKSLEELKLHVKTFTGKTISLSVYPMWTIAAVKWNIECVKRIPFKEQALILDDDTVLSDSGTLFDFYIIQDTTLTLLRKSRGPNLKIDIWVPYTKETVSLLVKHSDTIGSIKAKLEGEINIPSDKQELIFNGMVLDYNDTLANHHINKVSKLTLMRVLTGVIRVWIKTPTGMRFTLEVKPSNTIRDVKSMIQDKLGIPRSYQRLVFKEKHLEDNNTLAEYHIHHENELYLKFDD